MPDKGMVPKRELGEEGRKARELRAAEITDDIALRKERKTAKGGAEINRKSQVHQARLASDRHEEFLQQHSVAAD